MAGKKISELNPVDSLNGSEEVEVLQIGANKRSTLTSIKNWIFTLIGDVNHNSLSGKELASDEDAEFGHLTKAMYDNLPKLDEENTFLEDQVFESDITVSTINGLSPLRSSSITSASSITPVGDGRENEYYVTALAVSLTINAPSGTATNGNTLLIRIEDSGTARALTWNAIYESVGATIPTTTVAGKKMYIKCIYNSTDTKWDVIGVYTEDATNESSVVVYTEFRSYVDGMLTLKAPADSMLISARVKGVATSSGVLSSPTIGTTEGNAEISTLNFNVESTTNAICPLNKSAGETGIYFTSETDIWVNYPSNSASDGAYWTFAFLLM